MPAIKGAVEWPSTALVEAIIDSNERPTKARRLKGLTAKERAGAAARKPCAGARDSRYQRRL